jgi:phosphomannomutase
LNVLGFHHSSFIISSLLIRSISGLRGIVGESDGLSAEVVARYASSFARYNDFKGAVAVGYDGRLGGARFYEIAIDALVTNGCDVFALGVVPTPTVMMAVETKPELVGGIIITASHNPGEWNGMKFIAESGLFLDAEENKVLWDIVDTGEPEGVPAAEFGDVIDGRDFVEQHIQAVLDIPFIDREKIAERNFRIVLDCVNASGSRILPRLLHSLGVADVIELHCDGSGIFPHRPEPVPENLTSLKEAILREKADLGIVVDPDADRLVLIMENGEPFIEENTIVLCAEHVLKNSPRGQTVVINLSTTRAIEDIAEKYSAKVFRTAVGEINVAKKMLETNAIIGGEGSGGVILPMVHTGRDSLVGTALCLSSLAEFGGYISAKRKELPKYEIVKSKIELKSQEQVREILSVIETKFSGKAKNINREDGIRIDFERSWIHARASNTEPIIRIIAEAPTRAEAEQLISEASASII